jgi:hypothetical protein
MFGKQEASAYLVRQVEECQSGLINQRKFPEGAAWVFVPGWRLEVEGACLGRGVLRGGIG